MSSGTKAKSKSVSLEPELWEKVEAKAAARYAGNRSAYLRELAEKDLSGRFDPAADHSAAVVELARLFHSTLAGKLARELAPAGGAAVDQGRVIARFLEALHEAMTRPGESRFNPERPFEIFSSEEKFREAVRQSPAIVAALRSAATFAESEPAGRMVNEAAAAQSPAAVEIQAEIARKSRVRGKPGASATRPETPAKPPR